VSVLFRSVHFLLVRFFDYAYWLRLPSLISVIDISICFLRKSFRHFIFMAHTVNSGSSARLSPAEKLARSLTRTAGPLSTSRELHQLLTFTNRQQNESSNSSEYRSSHLQLHSSNSSSSSTFNSLPSASTQFSLLTPLTSATIFDIICNQPALVPLNSDSSQSNDDSQSPSLIESSFVISRPIRRYTPKSLNLPLARQLLLPGISYRHHLGLCNTVCVNCNALHWKEERSIAKSTQHSLKFQMCCADGKVLLSPLSDPPEVIRELLQNTTSSSTLFTLFLC